MVSLVIILTSTSLFTQYTEKNALENCCWHLSQSLFKLYDGPPSAGSTMTGSRGGQQQMRNSLIHTAIHWNSFVSHCSILKFVPN